MDGRFGDYIRPKSSQDLVKLNRIGDTLNRLGLKWFYFEMRGNQKYYIRISKPLPENEKWYGGLFVSFAYLKKK